MKKNILLSICLALAGSAGFGASPAFGRNTESIQPAPVSGTAPAAHTNTKSADSAQPGETLNQAKVHDLYNSGDFEPVIAVLEAFIQRNKTYSHSDSVFIAKHLAVVYSANPATREKGKYYMFRLLELLPSAKLVDMYVSDEVDRIFDKVREEFLTRQHGFGVDTSGMVLPARGGKKTAGGTQPKVESNENHSVLIWSCVVGSMAAASVGGYLWYQTQNNQTTVQPGPVAVKVITPQN